MTRSMKEVKKKKIEKVIRKRYNMVTNQVQYLVKWEKVKNSCWVERRLLKDSAQLKVYERYLKLLVKHSPHQVAKGLHILFPVYGQPVTTTIASDISQFIPLTEYTNDNPSITKSKNFTIKSDKKQSTNKLIQSDKQLIQSDKQLFQSDNKILQSSTKKILTQYSHTSSPIKKVQDYFKSFYRSVEKRLFTVTDEINENSQDEE